MRLSGLRLRTILPLIIVFATLSTIVALFAAAMFAHSKLTRSFEMTAHENRLVAQLTSLVALQKNIELDVVSTQESLTDVSATRAMNGLDDGFELAEGSAKSLSQHTDELKALASELGSDELKQAAASLRKEYQTFYANGVDMAKAYVAQGPGAGNRLMADFDSESDRMQSQIESLGQISKNIQDKFAKATAASIDKIRKELSDYDTAMIAFCIFIGAMGAVITLFVVYRIVRPLTEITDCMNNMSKGKLDADVPHTGRGDEIGEMAVALQEFQKAGLERISAQAETIRLREEAGEAAIERERMRKQEAEELREVVENLGAGLERLANCNIRITIDEPFAQRFEPLRHYFNESIATFQATLEEVLAKTAQVSDNSAEMRSAADNLSRRTEQQAAALEQTSAALEQVSSTVRNSADRTTETQSLVKEARECATSSSVIVEDAVSAMKRIEEAAGAISQIIDVIDQIAFQTNLLALNAGVEAARAGDAGKGFAVVAQEVRELAQRSANAAKEIGSLIGKSSDEVGKGVTLVGQTGEALKRISAYVTTIEDKIDAITVASREQAVGLHEISAAVNEIDQMTQQNAAMVEESTAISQFLSSDAERLRTLVGRFQLNRRKAIRNPDMAQVASPGRSAA